MKQVLALAGVLLSLLPVHADEPPRPLATGLNKPHSVAVGGDGRVYVTAGGEPDKGEGAVLVIDKGKAVLFVSGLDDPRGLAAYQQWLFAADSKGVWRIDRAGKATLFAAAAAFPSPLQSLTGVAVDPESGIVYVSDAGDSQGKGGAVYRVSPQGKAAVVTNRERWPELHTPHGLALDGASHLLVTDAGTGTLSRIKLAGAKVEKLADGLDGAAGLAWDYYGRLFIGSRGGRVSVIGRPGEKPVPLANGLKAAAGLCLDPTNKLVLAADPKAGTVVALPATVPGAAVDTTPLRLETALAFPNLQWSGWQPEDDRGRIVPLRPIVLTHAGDGSNRAFVATQHGVVHVFPNDQKATKTQVFLDIQDRVTYHDDRNEEGFLGLAFHPDYKKNGEFYVYYTTKRAQLTNIVSRFRVSKDDPNRADAASEEEVLRLPKPFWNHDGGTLCFGPDGYLYIAVGDGGAANDPYDNGQKLNTHLGKVLRIDVNRKEEGKGYAVPKDNPFVSTPNARPEVWAYGLRNVWRMAFDRKTGVLWAGDVGQNLYEEIDLLTAGGNYGWRRREGLHPFGGDGLGVRSDLIEPIWEYHHDVGKSITGGLVYRGRLLPELEGAYVYADYVSGKIWALRYDADSKRVVANRPIPDRRVPAMSFGEDEQGEVYFMTYTPNGKGLFRFVRSDRPR